MGDPSIDIVYKYRRNKIIVTQKVTGNNYKTKTTYFLDTSEVDDLRKIFDDSVTEQELLLEEGITSIVKALEEPQIVEDKKFQINSKEYYYQDDNANTILCTYANNIVTITRTDIETNKITETKYIDLSNKEIYTNKRDFVDQDKYIFALAVKSVKVTNKFIIALVECEYYCKHYLPDNIGVGDTNCSEWKKTILAISSQIISYQRIDAEENLKPKYARKIQNAYNKYNSGVLRSVKNVARGVLTIPTIPLHVIYLPVVTYAVSKFDS